MQTHTHTLQLHFGSVVLCALKSVYNIDKRCLSRTFLRAQKHCYCRCDSKAIGIACQNWLSNACFAYNIERRRHQPTSDMPWMPDIVCICFWPKLVLIGSTVCMYIYIYILASSTWLIIMYMPCTECVESTIIRCETNMWRYVSWIVRQLPRGHLI